MARLNFDFHARPQRPTSKLGIALALLGVAAAAWSVSNLQAARATGAGLALQIAALERARPHQAAKPAVQADSAAHIAQTRIASQLAYSWQPAFDALAAARSKKIALLSLEAVQSKAQLKLVAEARQLADAVAYIDALQQQPGIKRAALIQHELRADDAQKPVRFSVLVELRA
jgi:hypothetical protein